MVVTFLRCCRFSEFEITLSGHFNSHQNLSLVSTITFLKRITKIIDMETYANVKFWYLTELQGFVQDRSKGSTGASTRILPRRSGTIGIELPLFDTRTRDGTPLV
jgi:hypothetical protein